MKKLLIIFILLIVLTGCGVNINDYRILGGNQNIVEKKLEELENDVYKLTIKDIMTEGKKITINFLEGDEQKIIVRGDENILEEITFSVKRNGITISGEKFTKYRPTEMEIDLINITLEHLTLNGNYELNDVVNFFHESLSITVNGMTTGDLNLNKVVTKLTIDINGTSNHSLDNLNLNETKLIVNGNGVLTFNGESEKFNLISNGLVNLNAKDFLVETCYLTVNGQGTLTVNASEILNIEGNGIGSIFYLGSPNLSQSITGTFNIAPYQE